MGEEEHVGAERGVFFVLRLTSPCLAIRDELPDVLDDKIAGSEGASADDAAPLLLGHDNLIKKMQQCLVC